MYPTIYLWIVKVWIADRTVQSLYGEIGQKSPPVIADINAGIFLLET